MAIRRRASNADERPSKAAFPPLHGPNDVQKIHGENIDPNPDPHFPAQKGERDPMGFLPPKARGGGRKG